LEILKYLELIDKDILFFINQTVSNSLFDFIMPIITDEHNWTIPILTLITFLLFFNKGKGKIVLAIIIISLSINDYFCASILKPYFARLRPSHEFLEYINLLVPKGGKWSLPSNHASNIFALATIIGYFYSKTKFSMYFLAILVCLSRVYVGVHYPFDVITGALIGYSISWIIITGWIELKLKMFKRNQSWIWYDLKPRKY
jgi:undecaprenyl-diphosphatase